MRKLCLTLLIYCIFCIYFYFLPSGASLATPTPMRIDFDLIVKNIEELNKLAGEGEHVISHTIRGARLKVILHFKCLQFTSKIFSDAEGFVFLRDQSINRSINQFHFFILVLNYLYTKSLQLTYLLIILCTKRKILRANRIADLPGTRVLIGFQLIKYFFSYFLNWHNVGISLTLIGISFQALTILKTLKGFLFLNLRGDPK